MRYLLIDRILRLEYNKQIIAIKNVALSEDFFNEHFVGFLGPPREIYDVRLRCKHNKRYSMYACSAVRVYSTC